jgi:hypothetical protein
VILAQAELSQFICSFVAEMGLDGPGVMAGVRQRVAAPMAEHVGMDWECHAGARPPLSRLRQPHPRLIRVCKLDTGSVEHSSCRLGL